jgi:hypothetical protein
VYLAAGAGPMHDALSDTISDSAGLPRPRAASRKPLRSTDYGTVALTTGDTNERGVQECNI